jgi:hypothetical protein
MRNLMVKADKVTQTFSFTVDDLKDNSKGCLKFGPNLSQCTDFKGELAKFHDYQISELQTDWKSCAASTVSGFVGLELDTACEQGELKAYFNPIAIRTDNAQRRYVGAKLHGNYPHKSSEDQFYYLYKLNGTKGEAAGQITCSFVATFMSRK